MTEVFVFRMKEAVIDTTRGYIHHMEQQLRMCPEQIMSHTTSVLIPDEALDAKSYYVCNMVDAELSSLVNEAISEYRMNHCDIAVSLPATWVRGQEPDETWTLQQYGRILATVTARTYSVTAHVYTADDELIDLGPYVSIKDAMEAVHKELSPEVPNE